MRVDLAAKAYLTFISSLLNLRSSKQMRQICFTDAQIMGIFKEQEAGMPTTKVCRQHGLSHASFYKFKAKYRGVDVSDAHHFKSLEDKTAKLKRLLADTMLDNVVLKNLLRKN
jgi:putative transposase